MNSKNESRNGATTILPKTKISIDYEEKYTGLCVTRTHAPCSYDL
jgi:hypothetical protein